MSAEPPYVALLHELARMQSDLRRLESRILAMLRDCGITDEAISDVMDITPQQVGNRRRRKD